VINKPEDFIMNKTPFLFSILIASTVLTLISCSVPEKEQALPLPEKKEIPPPKTVEPVKPIFPRPIEPTREMSQLLNQQNVKTFIHKMVTVHHFNDHDISELLKSAVIKDDILKRIASPSEGLPWFKYRKIFLTDSRIKNGVKFWHENAQALETVSTQTGVAPEIIVAIIGVETGYGKNMGNHRVLDALATLAFAYPPRSAFFSGELEQFLLLCREENKDPREPLGSYAGAMGYPQFMPSSFRHLAKDFEHDGKRDIWQNPRDAIASVANYFEKNGWQRGEKVAMKANATGMQYKAFLSKDLKLNVTVGQLSHSGVTLPENVPIATKAKLVALQNENNEELWLGFHNFYVITRYNHSPLYAMAAYQLSQEIKQRR